MLVVLHDAAVWQALVCPLAVLGFNAGINALAYTTTLVGIIVVALWFGRIHLRLLNAHRQLQAQWTEALQERDQLRQGSTAARDFLARITHEMRVPLHGIVNFAALVRRPDLDKAQQEWLDRTLTSAEWLLHIGAEVLDYANLESEAFQLASKPFSLAQCVMSAVQSMEQPAQRKHLELTYRLSPALPATVVGDAYRLRQILVNLLENAVAFTTNGSVVLTAELNSESPDDIAVSLAVADTGAGIHKDDHARIFNPFQTASQSDGSASAGVGLGLSLCKRLVEAMEGNIEVQSQLGAGTTFRVNVKFKKVPVQVDRTRIASAVSALALRRLSVLLADEDVLSRRFATKMIESAGHQVSPAATAEEAIALFSTEIFDLVLISSGLPDRTYSVLIQTLRDLEDEAMHARFYLIGGPTRTPERFAKAPPGLDGVLSRPVPMHSLMQALNDTCDAKSALDRNR